LYGFESYLSQGWFVIEAQAVELGDVIYDNKAYAPSAKWTRVTFIEKSGYKNYISLTVSNGWTTVKHPEEAVAVRREPLFE